MKNLWISFCCVVFFGVTFFAFFKTDKISAQERGPASASGLNSTVPLSRELEAALERKKANLELQEREIKLQQQKLQEEEVLLSKKISDLETLLKQKEAFDLEKSKIESAEFQKIVKSFEKMPPKKAADVISAMDDKIALELLKQIKDKSMAAILAAMSAERAMTLTSELAKRVPASVK